MIGVERSAGFAKPRGGLRMASATCGGFAPSSCQTSCQTFCLGSLDLVRRSYCGEAKARRAQLGFEHTTAHIPRFTSAALPAEPAPVWCRSEQLSRPEGVISCGQSSIHLGWRFARACPAAATQPASRQSTAQAPVRLARRCWTATLSPVQRSVQPPMSSIAKKTPANAEGALALSSLSFQPVWRAQDIHANAAFEPWTQGRRFCIPAYKRTRDCQCLKRS